MLNEQGEYERAKEAYQRAIDSEHAEWAPKAVFNLGMLFEERGERDLAAKAYQRAVESGHSDAASNSDTHKG